MADIDKDGFLGAKVSVDLNDSENQSGDGESQQAPLPRSKLARWYRSTLFNVIIVGLISFTQPGIWNALNSTAWFLPLFNLSVADSKIGTGAGGQQEPYLVNGANSLTFGIMVFGCSIFAALANKFDLKPILIIGTLGYAPYSASLYVNNRYGTQWFVLFGATTCGIAASALWATEGAIALGYPNVKDRGIYTGIWLGLRELGQLIGAALQLSLNYKKDKRGKVGYSTYLVLIALQCLGLPLALLISPPGKAIRSDGTRVGDPTKAKLVTTEFKKILRLLKKKQIYLLIPVLITFNWNNTYQGIYLTRYFSVRARTLGALTSGIAATVADVFWGWFLDRKFFSRPTAAKVTWISFSVVMLSLFGWQVYMEHHFESATEKVSIDWLSPDFGRAFAVNVLFRYASPLFSPMLSKRTNSRTDL